MARPKKIGLDYFPHDVDVSSDEKLEPIEALFGNDGYAVFFKILERIYRAGGSLDMTSSDMMLTLAKKCNLAHDHERFEKIFEKCLSRGLFDEKIFKQKKVLTSTGIKKRVKIVIGKRLKNRMKSKLVSEAEIKQKQNNKAAIKWEIKEKEIKEKEIKEKETQISYAPRNTSLKMHALKISKGISEQEIAFNEFIRAYPHTNGKVLEEQETFRRFCLISQDDWPKVIKAAKHYGESERVKRGVGIRDPKNFLGNQACERSYWKEWTEPEPLHKSAQDSRFNFLLKGEDDEKRGIS